MRKILGFGVVLSVVSLTAAVESAYGQAGAGGRGAGAGAGGRTASTVVNDAQQVTNGGAATTTDGTNPALPGQAVTTPPPPGGIATTPGNTPQVPGTAGNVLNQSGVMPTNPAGTVPGNTPQVPGTAGTVLNQSGVMPTNPASTVPGTVNPAAANTTTYSSSYYAPGAQQGVNTGAGTVATPGYTSQTMPGIAGYNSVNPMGTTMVPGNYYTGTAGTPYTTGATTGYSSMYVTPGYYTAQPQTYQVQQRRGLFGGMFRRRNRVVYPASPYGYTTTGYTTYTTPGTYTYYTSP
jgi:hypothetical protein